MTNLIDLTDVSEAAIDCPVYLINNTEQLNEISTHWFNKKVLAIDTEFERRTTYYAKLALVQVYDGDAIYIIDPLTAECPDSLREVFLNPKIKKILHSSKEDLEVLYTAWNCKIFNLFDTQVAYNFLHGELSIGYAKLVKEITGIFIDKQETNSNWLKRPLKVQQLHYAANDVRHLIEICQSLEKELLTKDYSAYFLLECIEYCEAAYFKVDSLPDYRDAKDCWQLDKFELALFKQIFYWREKVAKSTDRTKNHIIRDNEIVQLIKMRATSVEQIKSIKDIHPRSIRLFAGEWIKLIANWNNAEKIAMPIVLNPRDVNNLKPFATLLESSVKVIAKKNHLPLTLLLSKRIIKKLALSLLTATKAPIQWQGWRKDLLNETVKEQLNQFTKI